MSNEELITEAVKLAEMDRTFCTALEIRMSQAISDLITALRASEAGKWQPIETAPKDGTHILSYVPFGGGSIIETYWHVEKFMHSNREVQIEYWYVEGGEIDPSHWQPLLPPPPVEGE